MVIIGVDPGTRESGLAIVDFERRTIEMHHMLNGDVLHRIDAEAFLKSDVVVGYEWVQCYGGVVGQDVFRTAFMCGRVHEMATPRCGTYEPTRPMVVKHFTGRSNHKKPVVREKILERFGGKDARKKGGPLYGVSNHKWDALAICMFIGETIYDIEKTIWNEKSWSVGRL